MLNRGSFRDWPEIGRLLFLLLGCLFITDLTASDTQPGLFSDEGYRIAEFRSPVPDSVPSASTITTEQLQQLIEEQPVLLIDVLPTPIKPKDRPDNLLWLPPARHNIPGSYWLPNVGFGALSTELDHYFSDNLARLSKHNKSLAIVIYCLADCWMSWNAAMRAAMDYGYSNVFWYPAGTTDWEARQLPLQSSQPIPIEAHSD